MNWGSLFQTAYDSASAKGKAAAQVMMSSAKSAAQATMDEGAAGADLALAGAKVVGGAIVDGVKSTALAAVALGKGLGNVASFGARTVADSVGVAAKVIALPYTAAKNLLSPTATPTASVITQCPDTEAAKRKRLAERQKLIAAGQQPNAGADRAAAASRLAQNNEAVELARLSDDAYKQYADPTPNADPLNPSPPIGWRRLAGAELKGVDPTLLADSQGVLYQTPADWPGGQKTVLAFRGTAGGADILVDHDQAMALATTQYKAAGLVGPQVADAFGDQVLVTGHSLGGGKAQAAAALSGLSGIGFNAAGLHPDTLAGAMPKDDQFLQYRTPFDPLTGSQNSPLVQTGITALGGALVAPFGAGMKLGDVAQKALGLSGLSPDMTSYAEKAALSFPRALKNVWETGNVLPPAVGKIVEVPALNNSGGTVSPLNPLGQHSITSVINGIESQKSEDVATLRGS